MFNGQRITLPILTMLTVIVRACVSMDQLDGAWMLTFACAWGHRGYTRC